MMVQEQKHWLVQAPAMAMAAAAAVAEIVEVAVADLHFRCSTVVRVHGQPVSPPLASSERH
jgi:hypothetical protein